MRSTSQRGVALVMTLIMLSLVTFLAIAFLGVSRRERVSMQVSTSQVDAQDMARIAQARATADAVARMLADGTYGEPYSYDLLVSTNYIDPLLVSPILPGAANVNYDAIRTTSDLVTNLLNLLYNPRPPVFIQTNFSQTPLTNAVNRFYDRRFDNRFYLDLNRNGKFDTNGFIPERDDQDNPVTFLNSQGARVTNFAFFNGDPEWIGVLEKPNQPHASDNRFVGRFAYIVLPAGKSLDLNYIHNMARSPHYTGVSTNTEGFVRNQGVGPWEINLAAFLRDLNSSTSAWDRAGVYTYVTNAPSLRPNVSLFSSAGVPFVDALQLLRHRYGGSYFNLNSIEGLLYTNSLDTNAFVSQGFDAYSDGALMLGGSGVQLPVNNITFLPSALYDNWFLPWPGGENTNRNPSVAYAYFDILSELFQPGRTYSTGPPTLFTNRLWFPGTRTNSYDRYTFYRMAAQLGVDSAPSRGKLNLNYVNDPAVSDAPVIVQFPTNAAGFPTNNLQHWNPTNFFYEAAGRMIEASKGLQLLYLGGTSGLLGSNTPAAPFGTNYFCTNYSLAGTLVPPVTNHPNNLFFLSQRLGNNAYLVTNNPFLLTNNYSVTNIPLRPINLYTPETQRLLQLAANIYDATTNRGPGYPYFPSVFRPIFGAQVINTTSNNTQVSITNVYIRGYFEEIGTNWLGYNRVDLDDPVDLSNLVNNVTYTPTWAPLPGGTNFYQLHSIVRGVPVIIGAKKGIPNFNEFAMQTSVQATRKLEFVKTNVPGNQNIPGGIAYTNQMFIIGVSNLFAVEAWNPYTYPATQGYPRPLEIRVTNTFTFVITNEFGLVLSNRASMANIYNMNRITPNTFWYGLGQPGAFRIPLFTNQILLTNSAYSINFATNFVAYGNNGGIIKNFILASSNTFDRAAPNYFPDPQLGMTITNWLEYALIERSTNLAAYSDHVMDYVNLGDLNGGVDLTSALAGLTNVFSQNLTAGSFWITNRVTLVPPGGPSNAMTLGISNQIAVSLNTNLATMAGWRNWSLDSPVILEIDKFRRFMGMNTFLPTNRVPQQGFSAQAPFSPTRKMVQNLSWEANDPFVHYTTLDLTDRYRTNLTNQIAYMVPPSARFLPPRTLGTTNEHYRPWGGNPNSSASDGTEFNLTLKDPQIRRPDDWDFPNQPAYNVFNYPTLNPSLPDYPFFQAFANVGWLGRVHRGTPWQTMYLKSTLCPSNMWFFWGRTPYTHPTNDWKLLDVFSTALSDSATRGMSVNQTNFAAWSAMLSGLLVLSNSLDDADVAYTNRTGPVDLQNFVIDPNDVMPRLDQRAIYNNVNRQLVAIYNGINRTRANLVNNATNPRVNFNYRSEILATPELSVISPYLNLGNSGASNSVGGYGGTNTLTDQQKYGINDAAYERIPQQILSLLTFEEAPRVVVYAYGQSLRPADRGIIVAAGPTRGLCTNYQITGEVVTRTVLRIEGLYKPGEILPRGSANAPPLPDPTTSPPYSTPSVVYPRVVVENFKVLPPD